MPSSTTLNPSTLPGSYEDRYAAANDLVRRGELEPAAALCARLIDRISSLPARRRPLNSQLDKVLLGAYILLAEIRARQGDWPALDDLCQRARQAYPAYADRWRIEPFMLRVDHDQPREGLEGLQALTESEPESLFLAMTLARAALSLEDLPLAEWALDRAEPLAAGSGDPEALAELHFGRFHLLRERGQWREAAQAWDAARALDPDAEDAREVVVRMLLGAGLLDDALRYVEEDALTPVVANYYRAWIAQQRGDQVRARYLWRKIVEKDPAEDDAVTPVVQASAYCWLRQPDAALGLLLKGVSAAGVLEAPELIALALAWAMHGDGEAARANLKLASQRLSTPRRPDRLLLAVDWIDFEQLVDDDAIKAELRPFFQAPPSVDAAPAR